MYLSMWILADSLQNVRVDKHIMSGEMCIRNASVLFGTSHFQAHTIYVGPSGEFIPTMPEGVLCVNKNDYFIVYGSSIEEVYEQLQLTIDFYLEWDLHVRDRIEEHCTLQEITEQGADILHAMVCIMNTGFIVKTLAGKKYASHIPEQDLSDLQMQSGIPLSHVNRYSIVLKDHLNDKEPYFFREPLLQSVFFTRNILVNGWLWGFCFFSIRDEHVPESQKQLFRVMVGQFLRWWDRNGLEADKPEQNTVFQELLQGSSSLSREEVWEYMNRIGWSETDEKYLCLLEERYGNSLIYLRLIHQISQTFSYCYVLETDKKVALVVNASHLPLDMLTSQLPAILMNSSIHIGISYPFQNLLHLPTYMEQAQIALQEAFRKNVLICHCSDCAIPYIRNLIRKNQTVNLEHPVARQIRHYDETHGTEYSLTLRTYLMEERSIQRTAAALQIHKNTLLYRIHRMQEQFSLNLDDRDERFRLILNYMIYDSNAKSTFQ